MNVLQASRSSRRFAGNDDAFIDQDIGYPNPKAQRRGHKVLIAIMLLAGIAALIGGLLQGAQQILAAFPTLASVLEGAAWMKLLAGLGQIGAVGLMVIAIALIWRWRIRRSRRHA